MSNSVVVTRGGNSRRPGRSVAIALALGMGLILQFAAARPVEAQRTGSRLGHDADPSRLQDAAKAVNIIAECFVDRKPKLVRHWLELLPGTKEEHSLLEKESLDLTACLSSDQFVMDNREVEFKPRVLRRPVAQVLVARLLPTSPVQSPMSPESDPWFVVPLNALPKGQEVDRPSLVLQDFGHCVVVHSWNGARTLLASEPNSAGEQAALRELTPVLGPCLSEGVNIELTPAKLREVLAEPMYHILVGASSVSASERKS